MEYFKMVALRAYALAHFVVNIAEKIPILLLLRRLTKMCRKVEAYLDFQSVTQLHPL